MNYGSVQLEGSFGPPPFSEPGRATPKPARRQTSFLTLKSSRKGYVHYLPFLCQGLKTPKLRIPVVSVV